MTTFYDLNNPIERAALIRDGIGNFGQEEIILSSQNNIIKFNDIIETLSYVFYTSECFIECQLNNAGIMIKTEDSVFYIKRLSDIEYKYSPKFERRFKQDEEKKIQIMENEFNSRFTNQELESHIENQSLALVSPGLHTKIEIKIEHFLNQYFNGRWTKYSIDSRRLDRISIQYTLKVTYDNGSFEINKPSNRLYCK